MPVTVVQQNSGNTGATAPASFNATLPGAPTVGNQLRLIVTSDATVTTPAGWTVVESQVNNAGHYVYGKTSAGTETSVTVSPTVAAASSWSYLELSGLGALLQSAKAGSGTFANTFSTSTTPSTTGVTGGLAIASWSMSNLGSGATSTASGYTNSFVEVHDTCSSTAGVNVGVAVATRTPASDGTFESTASFSANVASTGIMLVYAAGATSQSGDGTRPTTGTITGAAVVSRLAQGTVTATATRLGDGSTPTPGSGPFVVRKIGGGSTLRGGNTLRGVASLSVSVDGNTTITATLSGSAARAVPATSTFTVTTTLSGSAVRAVGGSGTLTVTATIVGTAGISKSVSGDLTGTAILTGTAGVTKSASGDLTVTAGRTGSATTSLGVAGNTSAAAGITGGATVTRGASGTTTATASLSGAGTRAVPAQGNNTTTATITGAPSIPTLFKTLHKALGHAPSSLADMITAFSPNTSNGGWHRGDGALPIPGTNWTAWCFNDFYVSDGAGGVDAFFRRNSVLMMDHDDGQVWWLSSGDGFPLPGSATFPWGGTEDWAWLNGGWATGPDSCMLLGAVYDGGVVTKLRVMAVTDITGSAPPYSTTQDTPLDVSIQWQGHPCVAGGYVYVYGIDGLAQVIARAAVSTNPAAYGAGAWEYWTGSGWTTTFASRGYATIDQPPLRALGFIPWQGGYLASAKDFDNAPELGPDNTSWTELKIWYSANPWGPWTYGGIVFDTEVTDWWSYCARIEVFPGMVAPSAIWSINTDVGHFDPDLYGPQFGVPWNLGDRTATAITTGSAARGAAVSGTITATVTLAGSAVSIHAATGNLTVTATPSSTSDVQRPAQGTLTGVATLTGSSIVTKSSSGTLTSTATLTGAGVAARPVDGTTNAAATITGSTDHVAAGQGTLTGTGNVSGNGVVARSVSSSPTTATGTITGSATVTKAADGSTTATAATTGSGTASRPAQGTTTASASISGGIDVTPPAGNVQVDGLTIATGTITGDAVVTRPAVGTNTTTAAPSGSVAIARSVSSGATTATAGFTTTTAHSAFADATFTVTTTQSGTVIATRPTQGTFSVTATVSGSVGGSGPVDGTITTSTTITGQVLTERPVAGDRTASAGVTGSVQHQAGADGVTSAVATISGGATVTRGAQGNLLATAVLTGVGTVVGLIQPTHTVDITLDASMTNVGGNYPLVGWITRTGVSTPAGVVSAPITVSGLTIRLVSATVVEASS